MNHATRFALRFVGIFAFVLLFIAGGGVAAYAAMVDDLTLQVFGIATAGIGGVFVLLFVLLPRPYKTSRRGYRY